MLEVVVWHEPELSRVVPVRPDGKISLPLILAPYIHDAAVAVLVREINASRVFVLGEVPHPGGFPLRGRMTVVQAIALAGGRTEFGGDEVVWLRSKPDGNTDRATLSFKDLVKGEAPPTCTIR